MSDGESELFALFADKPLVNYEEGESEGRTQLTLTPWEIRVIIKRVMVWHLDRFKKFGMRMGQRI